MFGELVHSASSPNIFMILCFQLPGGTSPSPTLGPGGCALFVFCGTPLFYLRCKGVCFPRPFCAVTVHRVQSAGQVVGATCGRLTRAIEGGAKGRPCGAAEQRTTRRGGYQPPARWEANSTSAKGAKIGRPQTTLDDIPANFLRHYPQYKNGAFNLTELARMCDISRTTAYTYIGLLER